MANLQLTGVRKVYPNGAEAVRGVDMTIEPGEFIVFVGPSGCGKSTLLRMVAGLETITDGEITIGERVINDVSPADRDVAMVFQTTRSTLTCRFGETCPTALKTAVCRNSRLTKR